MIPQAFDKISEFIRGWEACRLKPYLDQAGRWTVGWGHLMHEGDDTQAPITEAEADSLFETELMDTAQRLEALISVQLEQHQFDALLALSYNIGLGNFAMSTMRRCINAGDMDRAAAQFEVWCKVHDPGSGRLVPSAGLLRRRNAERAIFVASDYSGRP